MGMNRIKKALPALLLSLALACAPVCAEPAEESAPLAETALEAADLLKLDHRLYELGYRDAACSGELDEAMILGLENFQRANGLAVTGQPDEETRALLMNGTPVSQSEYLSNIAAAYNDTPALSIGSSGDEVVHLQSLLRQYGYLENTPDGVYGESTVSAVYRYQIANGLPETGIADGSTRMRLFADEQISYESFLQSAKAGVGESGIHVRRIQRRLRAMGYYTGKCVGRYGSGTQQAVSLFQSLNGLEVTGNADEQTCRLLYSGSASEFSETYTICRGNDSADALAVCARLKALGYPAGDTFDMNTEFAVMEFQCANGLDPTGAVDSATNRALSSDKAVNCESFNASITEPVPEADDYRRLLSAAMATVGNAAAFADSYTYVRYIALKSGIILPESDALTLTEKTEASGGNVVRIANGTVWGIATDDGGVICSAKDSFVVIRYSDSDAEGDISVWTPGRN